VKLPLRRREEGGREEEGGSITLRMRETKMLNPRLFHPL